MKLGTRLITFCTGTRDPDYLWRYHPDNGTPEAWRDMLDAVEEAVCIAEEYGVIYGHYLSCLNDSGFTGALILHSLSEEQAPGSLAFVRSRLISA